METSFDFDVEHDEATDTDSRKSELSVVRFYTLDNAKLMEETGKTKAD